jgi:hypothetical protein
VDLDVAGFTELLTARLAAIVPAGFRVELAGDMLWFRSDEGRFPGQLGDYRVGSTGIQVPAQFTGAEQDGTAEECAAELAWRALDTLQDYVAEATHEPWPGQRSMPEPRAQVRNSMLHLWYGDADSPVLACEPVPLALPRER